MSVCMYMWVQMLLYQQNWQDSVCTQWEFPPIISFPVAIWKQHKWQLDTRQPTTLRLSQHKPVWTHALLEISHSWTIQYLYSCSTLHGLKHCCVYLTFHTTSPAMYPDPLAHTPRDDLAHWVSATTSAHQYQHHWERPATTHKYTYVYVHGQEHMDRQGQRWGQYGDDKGSKEWEDRQTC